MNSVEYVSNGPGVYFQKSTGTKTFNCKFITFVTNYRKLNVLGILYYKLPNFSDLGFMCMYIYQIIEDNILCICVG